MLASVHDSGRGHRTNAFISCIDLLRSSTDLIAILLTTLLCFSVLHSDPILLSMPFCHVLDSVRGLAFDSEPNFDPNNYIHQGVRSVNTIPTDALPATASDARICNE
ncbi:hypothetical protein EVAR_83691_1 [Eumeta japonica]|uniref:Uncharacterized protein n=1 Tax=Eumeta variegata TaxID=151549 RepID=A0A4C1XZN4_EUMVA|nr:hypothetical protein EVAR_83691_1 [Eumeta japonica]